MRMKLLLTAMLVIFLNACAWVELNEAGKKVRVLEANEVSSCRHLGSTTANVKDSVAGMKRKENIVGENLETLARNAAVEMGGDTIVVKSPIKDGSRQFNVYKCVAP